MREKSRSPSGIKTRVLNVILHQESYSYFPYLRVRSALPAADLNLTHIQLSRRQILHRQLSFKQHRNPNCHQHKQFSLWFHSSTVQDKLLYFMGTGKSNTATEKKYRTSFRSIFCLSGFHFEWQKRRKHFDKPFNFFFEETSQLFFSVTFFYQSLSFSINQQQLVVSHQLW